MSLKTLAVLVFLLISGILGSTHCYLAADRSLRGPRDTGCCNTGICALCDPAAVAIDSTGDAHRIWQRTPFSPRRRGAAVPGSWTPCPSQFAPSAGDPRGS